LTVLSGGPGTGKTMLGLEFLVRGAQAGDPGILLTFEERETDLREYATGFGWDLEALEAQETLALISARMQPDAVVSGEFDLRGVLNILRQKAEALGATRVVIDAPDVFLRLLDDIAKERSELYALHEWLRDTGMTAIMTVKGEGDGPLSSRYEFLDYMAECVIHLDQRVLDQVTTRRLRVIKYRGSAYGRNEYPFCITGDRGAWIIPVTQTGLHHRAFGEAISSGVAGLDQILDGGYLRNSCTLLTGGAGTGKTTFASHFVLSATSIGDRVLYLDFEESWDALVSCMLSPGLDLRPPQDAGLLRFLSVMPESQGVERHLIQAFRAIEDFQPKHLVLDAISACRRMGSRRAAFDYLIRLTNHCKELGITMLLTNLTKPETSRTEMTGIDLSSVIDAVIMLRNVKVAGEFRRELGIIKARGRDHSSRIHNFWITDRGIKISMEGTANGEE
jgi:circadian clock protein KaiC